MNLTRPGVYEYSSSVLWSPGYPMPLRFLDSTVSTFTVTLAGDYLISDKGAELVRVAADPPIFPRMRLR